MRRVVPPSVWKNWAHFVAFGFGAGTISVAPGICGALVGVVIYYLIRWLPVSIYLVLVFAAFVLGVWVCEVTLKALKRNHVDGIVFDKIVGYLVAMIGLPLTWKWALLGLVLFLIFDIWKPWPISKIHKETMGGLALMLDDVIAGFYALIILQIFSWLMGVALPGS